MRRLRLPACVLSLVLMLAGCSVATQNAATPLPSQLTLTSPSSTTTLPVTQGTRQLKVYFLKAGRLFTVPEYYSTDPIPAALLALGIGPSADEANDGITTAFSESPSAITLAATKDNGQVALVEVDFAFINLPGEALEEASAQIVYTITGISGGPTSVEFLLGANVLEALVPPGQLVNRPVTRADYCIFAPVATSC